MTTEAVAEKSQHQDTGSVQVFGFWIYIMSDCLIFGSLFAAFIVLKGNTFGGPGMKQITDLPYVLTETVFLLLSSFTYGLAVLNMYKDRMVGTLIWLIVTFCCGLGFVAMEIHEFYHLIMEGHGPQTSGAMTGFFSLVGTHGFHVSMGLLWMFIMMIQLLTFGITKDTRRRLTYLAMFWAFLDIVWIFVYTIVYLMGAA